MTPVELAACAVLGVQLTLPIAMTLRQLARGERKPRASKATEVAKTRVEAAPKLAALKCGQCTAAVPLTEAAAPCPFCGATVEPPPEYLEVQRVRAGADEDLARAEQLWLQVRGASSLLLEWAVRLATFAWFAAVIASFVVNHQYWLFSALFFVGGLIAVLQIFLGLAWASALKDFRTQTPAVPERKSLQLPAERAPCGGCQAPVAFSEHRLAATCGYCEAVTWRAALAPVALAQEKEGRTGTRATLAEALKAARARRDELDGVWFMLAVAEVFFFGLGVLVGVGNWISSL